MRAELPASPRKQAVVVEGLASEYGYQVKKFRNNSKQGQNPKPKQGQNQTVLLQIRYCLHNARERRWNDSLEWRGKAKTSKVLSDNVLKEAYALYLETCENDNEKM